MTLPQYSKPSVGKMFFLSYNFFVFNKEKWKVVSKSHQGFKKKITGIIKLRRDRLDYLETDCQHRCDVN